MKLHGHSEEILQKRIVQLLGNTRAFREPFFKTKAKLPRHFVHPRAKQHHNGECESGRNAEQKPPGLPESRPALRACHDYHASALAWQNIHRWPRAIVRIDKQGGVFRSEMC